LNQELANPLNSPGQGQGGLPEKDEKKLEVEVDEMSLIYLGFISTHC
jgi:hypothetical protein